MNIDNIKYVYLIGIGGIGMSALARYFNHLGYLVYGYDKTETVLTRQLQVEGINIVYDDLKSAIPDHVLNDPSDILVIYTPAIPKSSKIIEVFNEKGHKLYKRSEVLGFLSARKFTIAVAGTHGKTTTSTMVAHILTDSGFPCSAFLGGVSTNYNTNALFSDSEVIVVEADEFDRSFLTLHPDIAIVTSMDADHLDIYGDQEQLKKSFHLFIDQVKDNGVRIVRKGLDLPADWIYDTSSGAHIHASNIRIIDSEFYFDYHQGGEKIENILLGIAGKHNVENAVAAIAAAKAYGIPNDLIKQSLANFKGVKRRFEYVVKRKEYIYIDDYAHHPKELEACFDAVNSIYPDKKMTVVFQPHLFSRTRDFADDFASVLSDDKIGQLVLLPIYPAREEPIEGVDSEWLLEKVTLGDKLLMDTDEVLRHIERERPELIVTVGAGNIDHLVEPIKEILMHV